ncbi:helix-turn-helix transcriptional regulator [Nocardia sp. NPDC050697]|uniref:helix-turn-helix domain-containing protein n=1 Tax=Nocardia sp. NPDC050697 TaxID=3155158 RepID=UPI00340A04EE
MAETSEVARRKLTRQLRELREAAGMTQQAAADSLEWSLSKFNRIEKGLSGLRGLDAKNMAELYARPDLAESLSALAIAAKTKSWYHEYGDVIPEAFDIYIGMEAAADRLRWFESELVPGIFQTEDYARTLIRTGRPDAPAEEVDRRVRLRLTRQALLTREDDPQDWHIVLPEGVLNRPVGGRAVMGAQLDRLLEVADLPNVTLGVIPVAAGMHYGILSGPFVLLDFPDVGEPTTVYIEGLTGALYTADTKQVDPYRAAFDAIEQATRTATESKELIAQAAKEMKKR